eukprot:13207233-Alexandrium_andersonii.AAC.1
MLSHGGAVAEDGDGCRSRFCRAARCSVGGGGLRASCGAPRRQSAQGQRDVVQRQPAARCCRELLRGHDLSRRPGCSSRDLPGQLLHGRLGLALGWAVLGWWSLLASWRRADRLNVWLLGLAAVSRSLWRLGALSGLPCSW